MRVRVEEDMVHLWDAATGEHKGTLAGHTLEVNGVSFSPDGKMLASAGEDGTVRLWNAVTGEHTRTLTGHTKGVLGVAFSSDGKTLASGSWDKTVLLWDTDTWTQKREVGEYWHRVASVSLSPDGAVLASVSRKEYDYIIDLKDALTGEIKEVLKGHKGAVNSVAFNPESGVLASGSDDGTVLLWKVD